MQGNIIIYTSNESFEESQKLRASLRKIGLAYQEQDISSKPGKSFTTGAPFQDLKKKQDLISF
jgi:hypothetical protein